MIKVLEISLGQEGIPPPEIGIPVVSPGVALATGYYSVAGQQYYYNASLEQWYYVAAGLLYPLAAWKPSPSDKLSLTGGIDKLRFRFTLKYIGPAVTRSFWAAVGDNKYSGSFNEWDGWQVQQSISIPECSTVTTITDKYIDVPIKTGRGGWDGAAYCKILDGLTLTDGKNWTGYYYDVFHIIGEGGEITEFGITKFEKA